MDITAAEKSYLSARRKAGLRALLAALTGRPNRLLRWDEVQDKLRIGGRIDRGLQTVPVEKIVGSVNRYRDFDRAFLPTQDVTAERWMNISRAYYAEEALPPVTLYKVGEVYFVVDGNHRVSVARQRGQAFIDAEVIEAQARVPLTPDMDATDLEIAGEYAEFLERTRFDELFPGAELHPTIAGGYHRLLEHIAVHRYFMGIEQQRDISDEEAVRDWYCNVYQPLVAIIRERDLLKEFTRRSEADLYLWIMEHWHHLRENGVQLSAEEAVMQFAEAFAPSFSKQLLYLIKDLWLSLVDAPPEAWEDFCARTGLKPKTPIEFTTANGYQRLQEHIAVHRHFMGESQQRFISEEEAAQDWYQTIYQPLVALIQAHGLREEFPGLTEADLYLRVSEHVYVLRQGDPTLSLEEAVRRFAEQFTQRPDARARKILRDLLKATTQDIPADEAEARAQLEHLCRTCNLPLLQVTLPGGARRLLEHVAVHRYFLASEAQQDVDEVAAFESWFMLVYQPVAAQIEATGVLPLIPKRTVADVYLWLMDHRDFLLRLESRGEAAQIAAQLKTQMRTVFDRLQRLLKEGLDTA